MSSASAQDSPERGDELRAATGWRAGAGAAGLLAVLYIVTAAPSVTWWDAGEFLAAAHTLGIPHPPGTPLYVMIARAWTLLFGWLDTAHSVNLLSGVCTALAAGIAASLIARATRSTLVGIAAALCAGTMSTVWLSATEAEVYGASLLLAMLMLWSGDRAGRSADPRFTVLTAYLFALAAPLHVTALVAAPAALFLAAVHPITGVDWRRGAVLGIALLAAAGIGTGRWSLGIGAVFALALLSIAPRVRIRRAAAIAALLLVGFSAFAFLLIRARHDPGINQGNPSTLTAMLSVIARDQYIIAGLLPRQAPVWLQIVNFFEYADWQVALGFGPTVTPTVPRTLTTIAFIALGAMGFLAHRRVDRRSWQALSVLGLCGSLGVIAYLNLKAGPSIGYGFIPDTAPHEPRERDYFFVLAFWTWGIWAGLGAIHLAAQLGPRRQRAALALGVGVAALPSVLNFAAMNRRSEPEVSLPLLVARELLEAAPDRAMLLVAGDNDTYPLWYAQHALGIRPDVIVLTYPLISAGWYRDELRRRWGLGSPSPAGPWRGMSEEIAILAASARAQARPIAAAVTADRKAREQLGQRWRFTGLVYVEAADSIARGDLDEGSAPVIDRESAEISARRLEPLLRRRMREAIDPTGRLMRESLACPSLALRAGADTAAARLLDSTCNYR
jgi:hypothetical protein